jgi:AcrR family transcriptional regulator
MKKGEIKRHEVIERLAAYILSNGLKEISLRQLAKAAKASDRMLIHYFKDKDAILKTTLTRIADDFIAILEQTKTERMSFSQLMQFLTIAMNQDEMKPYIKLWLDLIASAAIQEEPFLAIAQQISDAFYFWIVAALRVKTESELESQAALALATIEGFVLLDGLKRESRIQHAMKAIQQMKIE